MSKKAVIFGITGQDGSYLTEHLLNEGYEVHGLARRNSITENQQNRLESVANRIQLSYGDLLDVTSIETMLQNVRPDEVYNLAAQSHVKVSYEIPQYTIQVNALGALNVLEAVRKVSPESKFYQAASSEMFGNSVEDDQSQNENTPMHPVSPYGCSKLFAYSMTRNYRHAYNLFASNGILFNHESPRRASNFVTSKIVKNAVMIKKKLINTLELGNLDSRRDWGHSRDYVQAMHKILLHHTPDDFVIATGQTHSVREFCDITFGLLGMNYEDYVVQNPKYMRPEELNYLRGDATKAQTVLGWTPTTSFEKLVEEMIEHWQAVL